MARKRRFWNRANESDVASLTHRAGSPSTPPGVLPPARSQTEVTAASAMSLAGVYRALSIIATGVSQMTVDVWRGADPIDAPAWVRRPDVKKSRSAFFEETTVSLASTGNAYWRILRDTP